MEYEFVNRKVLGKFENYTLSDATVSLFFLYSHSNNHHEMQKATVPRSNNSHRAQGSILKNGFWREMGERWTPTLVISLVCKSVPSQWVVTGGLMTNNNMTSDLIRINW